MGVDRREAFLIKDETLSDSGTKIESLAASAPISAIDIIYEATSGSTSARNAPIHPMVTKIEVVDGADVLCSGQMKDLMAIQAYQTGRMPYMDIDEQASVQSIETCRVHFGRYLWDEDYFLDPDAFTNLQIKLTHALTIAADLGYATGTGKLSLILYLMEGLTRSPRGVIVNKEIYTYTSSASGVEVVELPEDYPIRGIYVHSLEANIALATDLTNIKLSLGNDKFIPFDYPIEDIITRTVQNYGAFEYEALLFTQNDDVYDVLVAVPKQYLLTPKFTSATLVAMSAHLDAFVGNRGVFQVTEHNVTSGVSHIDYATDLPIHAVLGGYVPFNVIPFEFAPLGMEDHAIEVSRWKRGQLKLTDGAAGASNRVIVQQFRS